MDKKMFSIAFIIATIFTVSLLASDDKDDSKSEKSDDSSTQSKDDSTSSTDNTCDSKTVDRDLYESLMTFDVMR